MTREKLNEILASHKLWLATDGEKGRRAYLEGADLSGADLCGADLRGAILYDAHLGYADLGHADLGHADLGGANLSGAYLSGAKIRDADLRGAILSGADLSGANLSGANLSGARLEGADLRGARLEGANLKGANLKGANLRGAKWGDVPVVEDLDRRMAQVVGDGSGLEMSEWHGSCGTVHCRAGWAVVLAGEPGVALERRVGPETAGALIYARSTPDHYIPDFYADNDIALADIKRRANPAPLTPDP